MKSRFSTVDIVAVVNELQKCIGMRVNQVYDVDNKTYLLKLCRYEEKVTLLLESGIRIHTTDFDWPKNSFPSGFSMKLRKHIKNKRLERLAQLGVDRILDLQFGINEAAYHVILELYDRGNLVLTDCDYVILNILRPRTDNDDVKFVVREKYPVDSTKNFEYEMCVVKLKEIMGVAKPGDNLRKLLLSLTPYGPALLSHVLLSEQFSNSTCIDKGFDPQSDIPRLISCMEKAQHLLQEISHSLPQGYIIQEEKTNSMNSQKFLQNAEFHPYLFQQYKSAHSTTYSSFNEAVDNFFSRMETQKIDSKVMQKEREAMKKLENVKKDHDQRLNKLLKVQEEDVVKASLIEMNLEIVDKAILVIRSAIASQISWSGIWDLIQEAQVEGDPIAGVIKKLKLEVNNFTVLLGDPFVGLDDGNEMADVKPQLVDIDLDLSAYGNARKYYDRKRQHARKEQKTLEASEKAFKNAEKKTKVALKEAAVISTITKARKPMWFEKFIWFISSENYLVIAGRDIQQNEVIVKRYMKPGDVYVHADIHGASSVVIKNYYKNEIPPKTLNEAGTLAVCYSTAWEAKVLTSAWWVHHDQVSKTAPTGEYLSAGSFMIRGKKNYLLPSHLVLGFGFLFKLADDSLQRHTEERKVKCEEEEEEKIDTLNAEEADVNLSDSDDDKNSGSTSGSEQKCTDTQDVKEESLSAATKEGSVSTNETETYFPDTKVHLDVLSMKSEPKNPATTDMRETTLIIATSKRGKIKKGTKTQKSNAPPTASSDEVIRVKDASAQPKRGQKSKLKKIKEKYRDQDAEERELRMKILASAGVAKGDKKKKKPGKTAVTVQGNARSADVPKEATIVEVAESGCAEKEEEKGESDIVSVVKEVADLNDDDDDDDDELGTSQVSEEVNLLNSLTGNPSAEDSLLFAIPVCGSYASMQNYKYKMKMMPGTGRRGKAAKTALNIFIHDRDALRVEKDCLRSVKDQDISRNFPTGKVKLSYPNTKRK